MNLHTFFSLTFNLLSSLLLPKNNSYNFSSHRHIITRINVLIISFISQLLFFIIIYTNTNAVDNNVKNIVPKTLPIISITQSRLTEFLSFFPIFILYLFSFFLNHNFLYSLQIVYSIKYL